MSYFENVMQMDKKRHPIIRLYGQINGTGSPRTNRSTTFKKAAWKWD